MTYLKEQSDEDLLDIVLGFAEENPQFDNTFAESLEEWLEEKGQLTEGQRQELINIIDNFQMDY